MIKKTLIAATAVAALSTAAVAGDATLAGTNDNDIVVIPTAVAPAGSSAGLLGSGGGIAVPAILGAALLAAALSSGGSS